MAFMFGGRGLGSRYVSELFRSYVEPEDIAGGITRREEVPKQRCIPVLKAPGLDISVSRIRHWVEHSPAVGCEAHPASKAAQSKARHKRHASILHVN